jgi:hypothetical protein
VFLDLAGVKTVPPILNGDPQIVTMLHQFHFYSLTVAVLARISWVVASFSSRQFGQYQGAGVLTGFGLRLRHPAQRKRLPFAAVLGRTFFPVLGKFFIVHLAHAL